MKIVIKLIILIIINKLIISCNQKDSKVDNNKMKINFQKGTILKKEHLNYLNSIKSVRSSSTGDKIEHLVVLPSSFKENYSLSEEDSKNTYHELKRLGYLDDCGLYTCDNGYACNPNSPPPNCGSCTCSGF
jgi:hypothetical protein